MDQVMALLADRNVQYVLLGIGGLIALGMFFNFVIQLVLIAKGLYTQVERRHVDWDKVKGGLFLIVIALLAYAWLSGAIGIWLALFLFLLFVGVEELVGGLLGTGAWIRWRW